MTYLQFHLLFLLPPLAILSTRLPRAFAALGPRARLGLIVIPLIALVYTTPWDNYLVANEIWGYGEGRVLGTIGWVPIEEYAFFVLQPLLTGMILYVFLVRLLESGQPPAEVSRSARMRFWGTIPWLAMGAEGALLLSSDSGRYMGLILIWSAPILLLLWLYCGPLIVRFRAAALPSILLPTFYLWFADRTAIDAGTWTISDRYTLGAAPLGLPVEEATFFLVTNIMVVFGLLAVLAPVLEDPRLVSTSSAANRSGRAG
jgi:lycopene cyclase domain-containing protein